MLRFSIIIVLAITTLTSSLKGICQNQPLADSLVSAYIKMDEGSEKLEILKMIAENQTMADSTLYYGQLLLEKAIEMDSKEYEKSGILEIGHGYNQKGEYQKAISYYIKYAEIAIDLRDKNAESGAYIAIGDAYSLMGDHSNSVEFYNRGIRITREINDSIKLATALLNAGDEYFNYGSMDTALRYFEESGQIFNAVDYKIGTAYNLGNMGMVLASQGRHNAAENLMIEASAILQELEDYYPISVYYMYIADIYLQQGDIDRALLFATNSLDLARTYQLNEQIMEVALKISEIYESTGLKADAFDYLKIHNAYRDSLNKEEMIRQIADLRTEFEVSQKQVEVDLANQQKRNQQIISIALVSVLSLSAILLITLYRNNQQRKKTNRELATLNETKDKFFSIISHDLRGPVSSFYGITRIIKMYLKRQDYKGLNKLTDEIDRSVKTLGDLLDNLLNWAIQQREQLPYQPEKIALKELFTYVTDIFNDAARAKNINFEIPLSEDFEIFADRNTTQTILRNLVSNAIKFTPAGGTISLKGDRAQPGIAMIVSDNGIGIPQEKLDSLFSFKARKSTFGTSGEKGLGLGLQLVYEFVSLNKGEIEVTSREGKGTSFTVLLPEAPY